MSTWTTLSFTRTLYHMGLRIRPSINLGDRPSHIAEVEASELGISVWSTEAAKYDLGPSWLSSLATKCAPYFGPELVPICFLEYLLYRDTGPANMGATVTKTRTMQRMLNKLHRKTNCIGRW